MPDPHMPDMLVEVLKTENARLIHENHDLTVKISECIDQRAQFAQALAVASDENRALRRRLGEA